MAEVELLLKLFNYTAWANKQFRKVLATLDFEDLKIQTEYGLLLDRIIHIFASYEMWFDRIQGKSPERQVDSTDFFSWAEIDTKWEKLDEIFIRYLAEINESELMRKITYTSLDGTKYTRQIVDILLHLVQHPTYHRGQIAAILKQKRLLQFPGTDLVVFIKPEIN